MTRVATSVGREESRASGRVEILSVFLKVSNVDKIFTSRFALTAIIVIVYVRLCVCGKIVSVNILFRFFSYRFFDVFGGGWRQYGTNFLRFFAVFYYLEKKNDGLTRQSSFSSMSNVDFVLFSRSIDGRDGLLLRVF